LENRPSLLELKAGFQRIPPFVFKNGPVSSVFPLLGLLSTRRRLAGFVAVSLGSLAALSSGQLYQVNTLKTLPAEAAQILSVSSKIRHPSLQTESVLLPDFFFTFLRA
jgi:hypothetical protein